MTEEQKAERIHAIVYSCDSREELAERIVRIEDENAKLRELVRQWYPHMLKRVGRDALKQWGQMDVVKEFGIEVEE